MPCARCSSVGRLQRRRRRARDFVCHLRDVGVTIPGGKKLFERVSLGFLRGAKIGVLGPNGSGKSTLLKVIAGVRSDFDGERWVKDGFKVGYLPQEPQLDPSKNVYENIMDGLRESQTLLAKFDEVSMAMGEPDADFDALLEEQAKLQDQIETLGCWDLSHEVEKAMAALRVPAADADVEVLSGGERRRVALCRLLLEKPDMLLLDEPTNHLDAESVHWLEDFFAEVPRHGAVHHARPLLPGQRGGLGARAGPRRDVRVRGQLHGVAHTAPQPPQHAAQERRHPR